MPNQQNEAKIRDWLADNLNFIENGLQLIGKEYHLPDNLGAKGFLDLLCKDIYNNFVIIEIKRADASARQTITEVLKYYSLIKHNFKARESEIRIIILSTHWNELIRAYSETFHKTDITLKGFQIEVDPITSIPNSITLIEPLQLSTITRKYAFWQGLYLFKTTNKRHLLRRKLNERLAAVPVINYVLVDLDGPPQNEKIITPYALVAAFQKQSPEELIPQIKKLYTSRDRDVMEREEFEDEQSYQRHLEGVFIDSLEMLHYDDDADNGYAEKLDSMINAQNWIVKQINRYGIFKTDPRYDDELLLKELQGHDGNSRNKFVGLAESTQVERIREIRQDCMNSLDQTPQWAEFINSFFDRLQQKGEKYRLVIDIYNPDSLITSLYFTLMKANPNYLPMYRILVDYIDSSKTEVYVGELLWNQKSPTSNLFNSTNANAIADEIFELHTDPDNVLDSVKMGLIYTNKQILIVDNKELSNNLLTTVDGKIEVDDIQYKTVKEYIIHNQDRIKIFLYNYNNTFKIM